MPFGLGERGSWSLSPVEGVPGGSVSLGHHYHVGADSGHPDLLGKSRRQGFSVLET